MVTLRNSILVLFAAAILAMGILSSRASAQPSSVFSQSQASATTSLSYMRAGLSTTTYQIDNALFSSGRVPNMTAIDGGTMYIIFNASTTASELAYQFQFSNNNIDWYGESATLASPNSVAASTTAGTVLQEASTTVTHLWAPGISATSTKMVAIPVGPALHERVVFTIPVGADAGGFYTEFDLKKNPSSP